MAGRRTTLMDIRNLLRHLQVETNISAIERATGLNRRTILRYRDWASTHDLLTGPLPSLEALQQLLTDTLPFPAPPEALGLCDDPGLLSSPVCRVRVRPELADLDHPPSARLHVLRGRA